MNAMYFLSLLEIYYSFSVRFFFKILYIISFLPGGCPPIFVVPGLCHLGSTSHSTGLGYGVGGRLPGAMPQSHGLLIRWRPLNPTSFFLRVIICKVGTEVVTYHINFLGGLKEVTTGKTPHASPAHGAEPLLSDSHADTSSQQSVWLVTKLEEMWVSS